MRGMVIEMNDEQLHSLKDVQGFLDGTVLMDFTVAEDERYAFIARTVKRFGYGRLNRTDKAVVLRFLERVSGWRLATSEIRSDVAEPDDRVFSDPL